jgi:hypothetical protein
MTPIDVDVHFKYICPETECGDTHWISLSESKTKNFKIVCSCGKLIKPTRIKKIKVVYHNEKTKTKKLDQHTLDVCIKSLTKYGIDRVEASELINKAYIFTKSLEPLSLIKQSLVYLGESNVV